MFVERYLENRRQTSTPSSSVVLPYLFSPNRAVIFGCLEIPRRSSARNLAKTEMSTERIVLPLIVMVAMIHFSYLLAYSAAQNQADDAK